MARKTVYLLIITAFLIIIGVNSGFGQEETQPNAGLEVKGEPEVQWIWGEVTNIDTLNNAIGVTYFDYETDQNKDLSILVDEQTIYENVSSFSEIKPKDALSIDYIVSTEGKNMAKKISLEKSEALPEMKDAQPELTPEDLQPSPEIQE